MRQPRWWTRIKGWLAIRWASIRYPLGALVGWLGTAIGIIAGLAAIIASNVETQTTREAIWGSSLAAVAGVSFGLLAFQNIRRSRARVLGATLRQQAHASDILRETRNFLRTHALAARSGSAIPKDVLGRARDHLQEALTSYEGVFSATTGSRCRFCIKAIAVEDAGESTPGIGDFYIYTLARDALSARENENHDEKRKLQRIDKLQNNSDFLWLWSPDMPDDGVFFRNDLRDDKDYRSTSLHYHNNVDNDPARNRASDWPLWYVATIVWPIRQVKREALGIHDATQHGFLAVDSRTPNAFDPDLHVALGQIFANSLLPVLDLYTEILAFVEQRAAESASDER